MDKDKAGGMEVGIRLISGSKELPAGMEKLASFGILKTVPAGQILVEAGEESQYCYIVKSGRVVAYEYSMSGVERVYSYNEKNSLILEECVLLECKSPIFFKAATKTELICLDKQAVEKAISEDNEIAIAIMKYLSYKFVSSMEQIRYMNFHNATWKVCNLLLIMVENYGVEYDGKVLIKEKLSQQLISSMLGINRVTVVRIIKDLKDLALVEYINGFYCIRSVESLKKHRDAVL